MPKLPYNFKYIPGQRLTPPSTPGYYVQVRDYKYEDGTASYVVDELESGASKVIEYTEFEKYYRPLSRWDNKRADDIVDPPPPEDPDFDKDGFPTFISDHENQ